MSTLAFAYTLLVPLFFVLANCRSSFCHYPASAPPSITTMAVMAVVAWAVRCAVGACLDLLVSCAFGFGGVRVVSPRRILGLPDDDRPIVRASEAHCRWESVNWRHGTT